MCVHQSAQDCQDGDQCRNAHGFDELRQPGEDFKTEYLPRLKQKMSHVSAFKVIDADDEVGAAANLGFCMEE